LKSERFVGLAFNKSDRIRREQSAAANSEDSEMLMGSPLSAGTRLSRYKIRSKIGAGGMGEVYVAQDTQLDRTVALKILSANVAADRRRMQRFIQEAKAASGLNHPNILTVYEIGQAGPTHFIATEFIDGETLRQLLNARRMKIAETLDISAQVASALAAAHAAGIIHRDIKPENIMLRRDGIVKVLDFGLAKLSERVDPGRSVDAEAETKVLLQTEPGVVMGTAAYMSPEQARGKDVDARTDIFSLGAVIYETLSGRAPFAGETAADIIGALIHKEPQPLSTLARNIPAELQHIVSKALRKDRDERYQTVKSLVTDLRMLKQELDFAAKLEGSVAPTSKDAATKHSAQTATENVGMESGDTQATIARPTSSVEYIVSRIKQHKGTLAAGLAVLLLAAIGFGYWLYTNRASNAARIESLAVMPFANASGNSDVEYLSDGITESLINSLSQLPKLSVKARSSVFRYKGKEIEPHQVAKELSVQAILNGRLVQRGNDLALYLSLVDAQNGNQLWGEQYNRKLTDLVALQSEIARDVSQKLRARLSGEEERRLAKHYTENVEAYQLYLNGRFYWEKRTPEGLNRAIEYFGEAIARDSNYALAYAGLADAYALLGVFHLSPRETFPKAREAALNALRIDDTLAEAHAALGHIKVQYEYDWAGAEREYKRAIELNPNYANAHHFYALYLAMMGRSEEGLSEIRRAQELEPFSLSIHANVGAILCQARRYDEAISQLKRVLEMNPNFDHARSVLAFAYRQKGMYEEAISEYKKRAVPVSGGSGEIGLTYALSGRRSEALKELDKLHELSKQRYVAPYYRAIIYAGLGDKDNALHWLEKAYEDRSTRLVWIRLDPALDKLRSEPRFAELLRRMNLTT
jgi:serine/threonine protein kinase/tetratricopeptide (TPR) repeat protein